MTTDIERLRKRIDRRIDEAVKLGKDIDKLFDIIEERGQIIDTLARQVEQADVKRDMADDDCEMYKHATLNLEAETKRLQEVIDELTKILDGYGHWKEGDDV